MASRSALACSLLVAVCLVATASAASVEATTYKELLTTFQPTDFVFRHAMHPSNSSATAAGNSSRRSVDEFPILNGFGIAQTYFRLKPCAIRQPHWHQRASGLLFVIQADILEVGLVEEDVPTPGATIANNVTTGDSALFPIGLLHYQQNYGCSDAYYTITYNSEDPGTQTGTTSMLNLPTAAAAAALGVPTSVIRQLKSAAPTGSFAQGAAECLARCGLPAPTYPITTCAANSNITTAGRR